MKRVQANWTAKNRRDVFPRPSDYQSGIIDGGSDAGANENRSGEESGETSKNFVFKRVSHDISFQEVMVGLDYQRTGIAYCRPDTGTDEDGGRDNGGKSGGDMA